MEFIQQATEKIENEAVSASGQNVPAIAIYHYLLHKVKHDESFAKQVLVSTKALSKCFSYITEKAFEIAKVQYEALKEQTDDPEEQKIGVGMGDKEIFGYVDEYYLLDDAELERKKAEAKEKAEADQKAAEEKRNAERKAAEEKRKADLALKGKKTKTITEVKTEPVAQFDFFGEGA